MARETPTAGAGSRILPLAFTSPSQVETGESLPAQRVPRRHPRPTPHSYAPSPSRSNTATSRVSTPAPQP